MLSNHLYILLLHNSICICIFLNSCHRRSYVFIFSILFHRRPFHPFLSSRMSTDLLISTLIMLFCLPYTRCDSPLPLSPPTFISPLLTVHIPLTLRLITDKVRGSDAGTHWRWSPFPHVRGSDAGMHRRWSPFSYQSPLRAVGRMHRRFTPAYIDDEWAIFFQAFIQPPHVTRQTAIPVSRFCIPRELILI